MAANNHSGATVAVFGGAGALGDAVVERLAADGGRVVALDGSLPDGDRHRPGVKYLQVDALRESDVAGAIAGLPDPVWAIVNVVGGYTPPQPVAELDFDVLRRQLDLNLVTAAHITKHALARLSSGGAGGRIVHTSSRVAVGDGKNNFAYSVSKLAVIRLVEAAAAEVRDLSITVNCILPSIIDTPANREAMPSSDHARWPKAHELAGIVSFLVSDEAALISGAAIPAYGMA
jgi:NAD(P)-dependent dehydrogenase (short-subunit alcohol dehydrogenase family)